MKSLFRHHRDESGAAALEFAFVLPVLVILLMGLIEFLLMSFIASVVDGATRDGARFGLLNSGGSTREDAIRNLVRTRMGPMYTILMNGEDRGNSLVIDMRAYDTKDIAAVGGEEKYDDANGNKKYDAGETFDDTNGDGKWNAQAGTAGAGGAGQLVLYRVHFYWNYVTPIGKLIDSIKKGPVDLGTSILVRNEP